MSLFHRTILKSVSGNKMSGKHFFIIGLVLLLSITGITTVLSQQLSARTGVVSGIYIKDVIFTSQLNSSGWPVDQATSFDSTTNRIYCFLDIRSMSGFPMTGAVWIRWYRGSEQVAAHYFSTNSEPAIIWIDPDNGKNFSRGSYAVEVFINQKLVRNAEFEVE